MMEKTKPLYFCGIVGGTEEDHKKLAESFQKTDPNGIYVGCDHKVIEPILSAELTQKQNETKNPNNSLHS